MAEKPYDLAIVGAGTTGCILAARIAEKGVHPTTGEPLRIGLFDRGPYFKGEPRPGYGSPQRRHMFTNIAQDFAGKYVTRPGLPPGGQRKVPLQTGEEVHTHPTAALVGGGSLLYTAITQVPHEVDYEVWERETGADWTYQNLKAASEEVKRTFNIHQKPDALLGRLDHMFRDTAQAMGYRPYDATIAKKNCLGSSFCDGTNMCKYDAKMGSFVHTAGEDRATSQTTPRRPRTRPRLPVRGLVVPRCDAMATVAFPPVRPRARTGAGRVRRCCQPHLVLGFLRRRPIPLSAAGPSITNPR